MTYGTFCYIIKLTSFNINYLYQKAAVAHIAYNAKWKVLLKVNMALYKTLKKILRPHFIWEDYRAAWLFKIYDKSLNPIKNILIG